MNSEYIKHSVFNVFWSWVLVQSVIDQWLYQKLCVGYFTEFNLGWNIDLQGFKLDTMG